jgi:hypothetical protein
MIHNGRKSYMFFFLSFHGKDIMQNDKKTSTLKGSSNRDSVQATGRTWQTESVS